MKELIGSVTIYNEGAVIGVDHIAEKTGRAEDMVDYLRDEMGRSVEVMDVDKIDIDETSQYFHVEPPLDIGDRRQLARFCLGTLDDDETGGLYRPTYVTRWLAPLRYVS